MRETKAPPIQSDLGSTAIAMIDQLAIRVAKLIIDDLNERVLLRPRLLTYAQAANYLGFLTPEGTPSISALRQRKGQFPEDCHINIGKALRWDVEALDRWIQSQIKTPKLELEPNPKRKSKGNERRGKGRN